MKTIKELTKRNQRRVATTIENTLMIMGAEGVSHAWALPLSNGCHLLIRLPNEFPGSYQLKITSHQEPFMDASAGNIHSFSSSFYNERHVMEAILQLVQRRSYLDGVKDTNKRWEAALEACRNGTA